MSLSAAPFPLLVELYISFNVLAKLFPLTIVPTAITVTCAARRGYIQRVTMPAGRYLRVLWADIYFLSDISAPHSFSGHGRGPDRIPQRSREGERKRERTGGK